MKKYFLSFFFIQTLLSCSSESGQINNNEIRLLSENDVKQFILILPSVLTFANRYNQILSPEEKQDTNYNKHYFNALKKSQTIKSSIQKTSLKSVTEFMPIYKNVFLAYYSLKREITNETEMSDRRSKLDEFSKALNTKIQNNNGKITKEIKEARQNLESFNIIYSNLIVVKKYEAIIDKIVENKY